MPICGRGCMFAENPSPLPDDATTDAMVDLRHFHSVQGQQKIGRDKEEKKRVTVCFPKHSFSSHSDSRPSGTLSA
jgi:hypothetical protein